MRLIDEIGGRESVQASLRDLVFRKRDELSVSNRDIDSACDFDGVRLPKADDVEADPNRIDSEFFSRVSFLLQINADEALEEFIRKVSPQTKQLILDDIRKDSIVAAAHGTAPEVSVEDEYRVYVVFKILEEIDG